MGGRVEVWKLAPCGRFSDCRKSKWLDIHKLQEEIAAVDARVSSINEQIDILKAALPELDNKIRNAALGMLTCSFPLDELQSLKTIHFKLLHFWEDMSRKQLKKLECLSNCLQILEEQKRSNRNGLSNEIDNYKGIEEVQSDIRKNQELEVKLYLERISCVTSKFSSTVYNPLKSGPSVPDLQRIPIPSAPDLHRETPPAPAPAPAQEQIPPPSLSPRHWHNCKDSATNPSSHGVYNTIEV